MVEFTKYLKGENDYTTLKSFVIAVIRTEIKTLLKESWSS